MDKKICYLLFIAILLAMPAVASASDATEEEGIETIHCWARLLSGGEYIHDNPSLTLRDVCIYSSSNESGVIKTFLSGSIKKTNSRDNTSHVLIIKEDGKEVVHERAIPNMPGGRSGWELGNNLTEDQTHVVHTYSCEIANESGVTTYARAYQSSAPMLNDSIPPKIEVVAVGTGTVKYRNGFLGTWVPRQKIFVTIRNKGEFIFYGDIYMPFSLTIASSQKTISCTKKYEGILYPGQERKIMLGDTPEGNWRVSTQGLHARQYKD